MGQGVTGVKTAGDAGRFDDFHQGRIIADVVRTKPFANISIKIDLVSHANAPSPESDSTTKGPAI